MQSQKQLFNLRPEVSYLNCAYKAPLLKSSEDAAIKALTRDRNPMDIGVDDYFSQVDEVKSQFAQLVNCTSKDVALIPSSSYGFASVLNNIAAKPKGKAITIEDEFPSGYLSLSKWCKEHDNDLIIVNSDHSKNQKGKAWNEAILHEIDERTSLVLMSSVHWMNGIVFNLTAIADRCHEVGAKLVVDGTQSVGALPLDLQTCKIDALICAGYKWLFGPYSTGLAYFSPEFHDGEAIEESWMNKKNARNFSGLTNYDLNYQDGAAKFSVGETSNFILVPMVLEGLKQINKWEVPAMNAYCDKLSRPLLNYCAEIGLVLEERAYFSPHLFSLPLPTSVDPGAFKNILDQNKIFTSLRGQSLRVAINVFNEEADIERLLQVMKSEFKI